MPLEFEFEVHGDQLIRRKILRVGDRVEHLAPAFEVMVDQMRAIEEELFDTEGASSTRPWAALKESTLKHKARSGSDLRILHDTHRLRDSLTEGTGAFSGHPDQLVIVTDSSMAFGSTVPYARPHQLGTDRLERRRPLDFSELQKRQLIKGLQRFVVTGHVEPLA